MAGVAKQIIGSFEDIGRDIARESVKVPGDIVGKALESLGTTSKKTQNTPNSPKMPKQESGEKKYVPPREWLAELAGKNKQREPTVQERFAQEKQVKQEQEAKKNATEQKMAPLARVSTKAKRGNLFGSQQSSEKSKNSRAD
jgi:hypothetical protein